MEEYEALMEEKPAMDKEEKERYQCDLKAKREIQFALTPDVFRLVQNCESANAIWIRLREMYAGNEKKLKNQQTQVLSEFGNFKQKSDEDLEKCFARFNLLLSKLEKYRLSRKEIKKKVTFLQSLRSEWRNVCLNIKIHEQFDNYTVYYVFGILRNHEDELSEGFNNLSIANPLALLSKESKKSKDVAPDSDEDSDDEVSDEVKELMVTNAKKFFKKNYGKAGSSFVKRNFRNDGYRRKEGGDGREKKKEKEEKSEEKKLIGDSGLDCYYCNGKNHLAKDCLLRKQNEAAKEDEEPNSEAYYVRKLERENKGTALFVGKEFVKEEATEEAEGYQIWSPGSDDEEMRKPTHWLVI